MPYKNLLKKEEYYKKNKDRISKYKKLWAEKNKTKIKKLKKQYRKKNKLKIKEYNKVYCQKLEVKIHKREYNKKYKLEHKKMFKKWYEKNAEKRKKYQKEYNQKPEVKARRKLWEKNYRKERKKVDKNFEIISRLRRLFKNLKVYIKKDKILSKKYGINYTAIAKHLKPFPENLENYEIHHIKPLHTFNFINLDGSINLGEVQKAFAPENHKLLTIEEHIKVHQNENKNETS